MPTWDEFGCDVANVASDLPDFVTIETSHWGDVTGRAVGAAMASPDGTADFRDIAAAIAAFIDPTTIDDVLRIDVHPEMPDQLIDMRDVAMIVNAVIGDAYPLAGPKACR